MLDILKLIEKKNKNKTLKRFKRGFELKITEKINFQFY